ncbi:DUF5362 family protein [Ferruginibacter lapsinanis]|uniref:DUF5362 family protein n=1 Tax=Ferruginibacter lapsinanis TaxID=563172 RepID=UPI001E3D6686|nr:DUF5362 family protein [Ferruginibacter lapsinanis]UEG49805.1 DUF5362 family protein [Ferruginibacter lapsinanis]
MEQNRNLLENDLIIDSITAGHLKETIMWAKFLGITGFVISALIGIGALAAGTFFSGMMGGRYSGDFGVMAGGSVMGVYLLIAAVAFFMSKVLFQFAKKAQVALKASDQENLVTAFKNLKIYFRFSGIIAIVSLIFSVLGLIGIALAASFSRY